MIRSKISDSEQRGGQGSGGQRGGRGSGGQRGGQGSGGQRGGRGSGGQRGGHGSGGQRGGHGSGGQRGGHGSGGQRGGHGSGGQRGGHGFGGQRGGHVGSDGALFHIPSEKHEILKSSKMGTGNIGKEIDLISNFYRMIPTDKIIYHYDIDIKEKDRESENLKFLKKYSSDIISKWTQENAEIFCNIRYLYDGWKNMLTTKQLLLHLGYNHELKYKIENREQTFQITINNVAEIPFSQVALYYSNSKENMKIPQIIITVLEILFKNICQQKFQLYHNKFFDMNTINTNKYYQFVHGFIQSVCRTEFGLAINLHPKTECIITSDINTLEELIYRYMKKSPNYLRGPDFKEINSLCRHLKIFTSHCGKKNYLIERIEAITPMNKKFLLEKEEISVAKYFQKQYKITLKNYPLVMTTGKNAKFIPLELCFLVDKQFLNRKNINDFDMKKQLLFESTHSPDQYFSKINNHASTIWNTGKNLLEEFGVNFTIKPALVKGRVLPEPKQLNAKKNEPFYDTPNYQLEWILFSFDANLREIDLINFGSQLTKTGSQFGLSFKNKAKIYHVQEVNNHLEVINVMKNIHRKARPLDIALIIIPDKHKIPSEDIYNIVKAFGDRAEPRNKDSDEGGYGLVTQCIKSKHVIKTPRDYFKNLLLKLNGKIGGINTIVNPEEIIKLQLNPSTTMVIGIDTNHPATDEKVNCSITVAVGSYDDKFSKYTASIYVQPKEREEIVDQLDIMIKELLDEFFKKKKCFPDTLIVFRDGVSEGQFEFIRKKELPLIQNAANKCNKKIKIVLFVVQKRHHTRFISIKPNERNSLNVPSGTVVDNSIVDPQYDCFYINSHSSLLGTSRPTKYVVLRNDLKMKPNQLQQLCFYMCYNYTRYRGVTSIPTPIRYADLCAYRSKLHVEIIYKLKNIKDQLSIQKHTMQLNKWIKIHENIQNLLYYC